MLYNPGIDDTFFITRFVSGLREDIWVPIMLHRSGDVDTASALALIQEQELNQAKGKNSGWDFTRESAEQVLVPEKTATPAKVA